MTSLGTSPETAAAPGPDRHAAAAGDRRTTASTTRIESAPSGKAPSRKDAAPVGDTTAATLRPLGTASAAGTARLPSPTGTAGSAWRLHDVEERPLVVMIPPLVEANRLFLALADDPHHAAGNGAAEPGARGGATGRAAPETAGGGHSPATRLAALCRLPGAAATLARNGASGGDGIEVLPGNGIFVFLSKVAPLDEHVDAGRERLGALVEEADGADVLLTAKDEFFFLLPLGLVPPDRQRDGHEHRHHRHGHEQGGHRIAFVAGSSLTP